MDGTIHLDVDIVTDSVGAKVGGEMDITFPPKRASKEITCTRSLSMSCKHL